MKARTKQQIEELFLSACELEPAKRGAFLEKECTDEAVRKEVESLLRYQEQAEKFMQVSALESQAESLAEDWKADASASLAGKSLGRYQILERLAAGGMGIVYRAYDAQLNRLLAIKVLSPGTTADEECRARFLREAKTASALNHPNIVTIYDIGRAESLDFIAMEYVEGSTLRDLLSSRRLSIREALDYAVQVVRAMVAAHSAGIIHRDIKPQNIMIGGTPPAPRRVKVLDFGIAKLPRSPQPDDPTLTAPTFKDAIVGTAAYMSPEQAQGKPVDERSDIFSFGAVLYEMLSGCRAFDADSSPGVIAAVLHVDPPHLTGVPSELQNIVLRCLRKDPKLRFQHASELSQALEAFLSLSHASSFPLKSIAVLPFANLSAEKENDYFSEGLAEEMINSLAKIPGLQVTARTSSFAFRGKDVDIREIGARLNVEYVLEGSVRKAGHHIRVTAQLINVSNGYHLWSERYDREMTDVFTIQDGISQAIVATLRLHLEKDAAPARRHTASPEVYTLYLRGRHYQEKRTPDGYARAKQFFEQALAEDAKYAPALLGLAEFYWQNALYGFQNPREALAKGKEATIHALEIDDALPEAHAMLGALLAMTEFDWLGAEREFRRALELDPHSPYVLLRYANYYLWPLERLDEATAALERSLTIDPLSVATNWVLGYYMYSRRLHDRALRHLQAVIELEPAFYPAHSVMGLVYIQMRMPEEAIQSLQKGRDVCAGHPLPIGMLVYGLGKAGRTDEAMKLIEQLEDRAMDSYVPAKSLMFAWAGVDDWDRALTWADKAVDDERDPMTVMNLRTEPLFDPIRSDPRYEALLRKLNIP